MHSLGIDLSTDPKKVWLCEIDWGGATPRVVALDQLTRLPDPRVPAVPAGDRPSVRDEAGLVAALVERLAAFQPSPERVVGIDAPFGWPVAFVDAISNWEAGDLAGFRKRAELRLRATDRFVQAVGGVTPLSVSVDRIGSTAMLCAEVLSRFARRLDEPRLDRARALSGVAEVYPSAALRLWTTESGQPLHAGGYKTGHAVRERLVRDLTGVVQPLPLEALYPLREPYGAAIGHGFDDPLVEAPLAYDPFTDDEDPDLARGPRDLSSYGVPADFGYSVGPAFSGSSRRMVIPEVMQLPGAGAAGVEVPRAFCDDLLNSDDALDAFLCALVARSIAIGRCHTIDRPAQAEELAPKSGRSVQPGERDERAERARDLQREAAEHADAEGWIHLPLAGPLRTGLGLEVDEASSLAPLELAEPTADVNEPGQGPGSSDEGAAGGTLAA